MPEAFEAGGNVAGGTDFAGDLGFGPRPLFIAVEQKPEDRLVKVGVRFGFN